MTSRKPARRKSGAPTRGTLPVQTKPKKAAPKPVPLSTQEPRVSPPAPSGATGPMTGPYHSAKEFIEWMAPLGPVLCEELFLRDPRWPRPIGGLIGGKRSWITTESLAAHARIMRERWPERERIATQREAQRVQRAADRQARVEAQRAAARAERAANPKRRGRPPKPKAAPPPA